MKTWTTKEGKNIKIADMENDHILNTIAFLQRKLDTGQVMVLYGGGSDPDDFWYDEEDQTEKIENWIQIFKLEILWRQRKQSW